MLQPKGTVTWSRTVTLFPITVVSPITIPVHGQKTHPPQSEWMSTAKISKTLPEWPRIDPETTRNASRGVLGRRGNPWSWAMHNWGFCVKTSRNRLQSFAIGSEEVIESFFTKWIASVLSNVLSVRMVELGYFTRMQGSTSASSVASHWSCFHISSYSSEIIPILCANSSFPSIVEAWRGNRRELGL